MNTHLTCEGEEVAVELHVGHDLCQVLVVLHILIQLQEHSVSTQHERHLLLNNTAHTHRRKKSEGFEEH